jgi:hypothetical protein
VVEFLLYRPGNFGPSRQVEYVGLTSEGRIILRELGRSLCGVIIADINQVKRVVATNDGETNGGTGERG